MSQHNYTTITIIRQLEFNFDGVVYIVPRPLPLWSFGFLRREVEKSMTYVKGLMKFCFVMEGFLLLPTKEMERKRTKRDQNFKLVTGEFILFSDPL